MVGIPALRVQMGASLVELLVSLSVSLFLWIGFAQAYVVIQKTDHLQRGLLQIQTDGSTAAFFMRQMIRRAGEEYCGEAVHEVSPDRWGRKASALEGYGGTNPSFLDKKRVNGTDSLGVGVCEKDAAGERFKKIIFFIGETDRKNSEGGSIYALYRMEALGRKEELVSNIVDMRLRYAIVTPSAKEMVSVSADQVRDWGRVRGVEVTLLVSSEEAVLPRPISEQFMGKSLPLSRHLFRSWVFYVAPRNL